jgi:hypothetical protein
VPMASASVSSSFLTIRHSETRCPMVRTFPRLGWMDQARIGCDKPILQLGEQEACCQGRKDVG